MLKDLEAYARDHHIPILLSDTAEYLKDFCVKNKPNKILEIGTAIGYSGSILLLNSNATLKTIEKDPENFEIASNNFKMLDLKDRVIQVFMDAKDAIRLEKDKYDLIFLDGPKGQYINYLPYLKKLLNTQGTLIADNVLYHGLVEKEGIPAKKHRTIVVNMRAFLDKVFSDKEFECQLIRVGDGIIVAKKII